MIRGEEGSAFRKNFTDFKANTSCYGTSDVFGLIVFFIASFFLLNSLLQILDEIASYKALGIVVNYTIIDGLIFACIATLAFTLSTLRSRLRVQINRASQERTFNVQTERLRRKHEEEAAREAEKAVDRLAERFDKEIPEKVEQKLNERIGDDIVNTVGQQLASQSDQYRRRQKLRTEVSDIFGAAEARIDELSRKAENSASLFKWLGILLAGAGVLIVAINFLEFGLAPASQIPANWQKVLISRATTALPAVLLAEILALVMFRYHSRALQQMRYFANEVTTLKLRLAAAQIIVDEADHADLVDFARQAEKLERNAAAPENVENQRESQPKRDTAAPDHLYRQVRRYVAATRND